MIKKTTRLHRNFSRQRISLFTFHIEVMLAPLFPVWRFSLNSVSPVAFCRDHFPLTGVKWVPGSVFGGRILKKENMKKEKISILLDISNSWSVPGLKCLLPNAINQCLSEPDEWTLEHYCCRERSQKGANRKRNIIWLGSSLF